MDAALRHQTSTKGYALRRIVVIADDENLKVSFRQSHQKVIQQGYRLGRGHRLVVDVAGNEHSVRLLPVNDLEDFCENVLLVLQHGELIDPLT